MRNPPEQEFKYYIFYRIFLSHIVWERVSMKALHRELLLVLVALFFTASPLQAAADFSGPHHDLNIARYRRIPCRISYKS
jgi:hypothetical protein